MTILFLTGFEYGVATITASGGGLASSISGTPTVGSSLKRSGSYSLNINPSAATEYMTINLASPSLIVGSISWYWTTRNSSSTTEILAFPNTGSTLYVYYDASAAKFRFGTAKTASDAEAYSVPSTSAWHRLDFRIDVSANPWVIEWKIDGVDQPNYSPANAAATISSFRFGSSASATHDVNFDDVIISDSSGDYPFPDVAIEGLSPGSDGTHNAGTNVMEDNAGTDIGATTAYDKLNSVPIGSTTTYVKQSATGTSNYAEVNYADTSNTQIISAIALLAYQAAGTSSDQGATTVIDEDATVNEVWGNPTTRADYSESSVFYKNKVLPVPAGGWDQGAVNALKSRIGYSNDVNPVPYWVDLMVEVAYDKTVRVTMNTATLASSGVKATIVPGAKTVEVQSATLASSGVKAIVVNPVIVSTASVASSGVQATVSSTTPTTTVICQTASLASSGVSATVVPGLATVTMQSATLVSSGEKATIVPGIKSVTMQSATLASSGVTATIVPGIKSVTMQSATLASSGVSATVVPGIASVTMQTATLASSGVKATIVPGIATATMQSATLVSSGVKATVVPGIASVTMQTATVVSSGVKATVVPGIITATMQSATLASSGVQCTVTSEAPATVVSVQTATLASSGVSLTVVPGSTTVTMGTATLASSGVTADVTIGLTMRTATLASSGVKATIVAGTATIVAQTATLASSGVSATIVPGEKTVVTLTAVLSSSGVQATVVPGAKSVVMQSAVLASSGVKASISIASPQTILTNSAVLASLGVSATITSIHPVPPSPVVIVLGGKRRRSPVRELTAPQKYGVDRAAFLRFARGFGLLPEDLDDEEEIVLLALFLMRKRRINV